MDIDGEPLRMQAFFAALRSLSDGLKEGDQLGNYEKRNGVFLHDLLRLWNEI